MQAAYKRVEKLARQIKDSEAAFDKFCWDILMRMPLEHTAQNAQSGDVGMPSLYSDDTAAVYVHMMRHELRGSVQCFVEHGIEHLKVLK